MTIQLGSFPEARKASKMSKRRIARVRFCPCADFNSSFNSAASASKSTLSSNCLIASAPIAAWNSCPYCSRFSRYSRSVNNCFFSKFVFPGSMTTYEAK